MRMIIGITALVLVWVFSMSGDLQALSLENMATVVQINSCQNCAGVEQQNLAFILQDINTNNVFIFTPNLTASNEVLMNKIANKDIDIDELLMNLDKSQMFLMWLFSVSADGDLQALSLENMATVVQINSCQNCAGVEQQNLAFILQDINTNNVFIFTPNLTASNEVLMNKIINMANVIQGNFCIECTESTQQNFVVVIQEIDTDDFLIDSNVYQTFTDLIQNEIRNIIDISQLNECVMCQNVDQVNFVFIIQSIGSEYLFSSTSEGIAQGSLFIDLVNLAMITYRRTPELNVRDEKRTYRKHKRYFVTARPGVPSPERSTRTR